MSKPSEQAQDPERGEERQVTQFPRLHGGESAPVRKELDRLLQSLFLTSARRRSVVFHGVERGVGCSWLSANMAELLVECRLGTVCLVDANLVAPALHSEFGVSLTPGLANLIVEPAPARQFARRLRDGRLWLVPSGKTGADPRILLNSDKTKMRILELRAAFDFVLIDTASGDPNAGASAFGQVTDGCVLVLDRNSTRHQDVLAAKNALGSAGVNILGAVLNRQDEPIPRSRTARP